MRCTACSQRTEESLRGDCRGFGCRVNLATGKATVRYRSERAGLRTLGKPPVCDYAPDDDRHVCGAYLRLFSNYLFAGFPPDGVYSGPREAVLVPA